MFTFTSLELSWFDQVLLPHVLLELEVLHFEAAFLRGARLHAHVHP